MIVKTGCGTDGALHSTSYEGGDPIPNATDVRIIVGGHGGTESCKTHLDNFQFPLPILLVSQSCLRGIIKLIKLATGDLLAAGDTGAAETLPRTSNKEKTVLGSSGTKIKEILELQTIHRI